MLDKLISDLEDKTEIAHEQIDRELRLLRESGYTLGKDFSKNMMDELYGSASKYRIDIMGFQTTVEETQRVLEDIAKDRVDLKPNDLTSHLEFFPKHLEIEVSDLVFRVRHLVLLRRSLEETLSFSFSKFEKMRDELQTSAQHKIAAIASIMLLPTFIVGLFGQNFRFGKEMEQHWGLTISSVLIVLTTIAQYFYFKRNKWL
jgi:magnesium transporter